MIYLDNAGTTKMFEECLSVHKIFSCENFFNPSALSNESLQVEKCIKSAESFILEKFGASEGNVIFTGCATESNNLAIKGMFRSGDWEYVFSAGEHPSVFNVAKKMELDGVKVKFVPLNQKGQVDLVELEKILTNKTRLISIMHVSNETGAINDLEAISKLKAKICPRAILHVDGVQGFMKIPLMLKRTLVDLYSFSGHKIHGPKGVAGLYVKKKESLKELFQGGGQQFGVRSGTENVSGIMQLKKAVELIDEKNNYEHVKQLKQKFIEGVSVESGVECVDFEGSPYILNVVFNGVKGETVLHALNQAGVIVGLGSACSAKKAGNRVLQEIGFSKDKIISSVRVSFNAYQTLEEIEKASQIVVDVYRNIRSRVS